MFLFLSFIPLTYILLGLFYAPVTIGRRIYLMVTTSKAAKNSPETESESPVEYSYSESPVWTEQQEQPLDPDRDLTLGREVFSMLASFSLLLVLASVILAYTTESDFFLPLSIFGSLIVPGIVFAVDLKSMWFRSAVKREMRRWRERKKFAMVRQIFMYAVALVGMVGAYILAFGLPSYISNGLGA